jgi:hypothetical protein
MGGRGLPCALGAVMVSALSAFTGILEDGVER